MNDLSATQRCVKCGLCLPHCPTFRLTGNEADSPRGRISLMQLLERPDTHWSPGLYRHLDRCLMCHSCEAMCPSNVPYGALMDTARQRLEARRRRTLLQRLLRTAGLTLLTSRHGRLLAAAGLRMVYLLRLQRLNSLPAGFKRLLQLLPESRAAETVAPARTAPAARGRVNLFTGCTGELFDLPTMQAARSILERLGYAVDLPASQTCCGALHQHIGLAPQARTLANRNREAFSDNGNPVLAFASGCCAHLQSYTNLFPEAADFGGRVTDIVAFLAGCDAGALAFRPLPEKVALYLPCTQRNRLGTSAVSEILAWIPQLQIHLVNPDGGCCGAAGSYMLTQPDISDRLRDAMVEQVIDGGSRILVTTNIGCSLQLGAGLRQRGASVKIMHPVALLAAQLE